MTKANKAEKDVKNARKAFLKALEKNTARLDALRSLEGQPVAEIADLTQRLSKAQTRLSELALAEKALAQVRARIDRFAPVELEVTEFAKQLRAEADPECDTTAFIYAHKVCGGNEIISRPIPRAAILGLL